MNNMESFKRIYVVFDIIWNVFACYLEGFHFGFHVTIECPVSENYPTSLGGLDNLNDISGVFMKFMELHNLCLSRFYLVHLKFLPVKTKCSDHIATVLASVVEGWEFESQPNPSRVKPNDIKLMHVAT